MYLSQNFLSFSFLRTRARGTTRPMDWRRGRLVVLFQFPLLAAIVGLVLCAPPLGDAGPFICFRLSLSLLGKGKRTEVRRSFRHLAEDWSNPRFWMCYKRRMLQETVQFYLYSKNIPV